MVDSGLLVQLAGMLFISGAVYGGIRSDQKRMREDIARLELAMKEAHKRIDGLRGSGRRHGDKADN